MYTVPAAWASVCILLKRCNPFFSVEHLIHGLLRFTEEIYIPSGVSQLYVPMTG